MSIAFRGEFSVNERVSVRVGTDVESVADVAAALAHYGVRYTRRLFTESELRDCDGPVVVTAPRLAARFAAKEAVLKLLTPTDENAPSWRSIEVRTAANGAPSIQLHAEAAELAAEQGVGPISVSLSHGAGIATATALALTDRT